MISVTILAKTRINPVVPLAMKYIPGDAYFFKFCITYLNT
jgi:hypothetical protein